MPPAQGVRGMRMGGQRKLIVPPGLAYGKKGIGEVPPDATLEFEVRAPCHHEREIVRINTSLQCMILQFTLMTSGHHSHLWSLHLQFVDWLSFCFR